MVTPPNPNAKVRLRNDPKSGAMRWGTKAERDAEEAANATNGEAPHSAEKPSSDAPATSKRSTRGFGFFLDDVEKA
jgi:hypothetical protein